MLQSFLRPQSFGHFLLQLRHRATQLLGSLLDTMLEQVAILDQAQVVLTHFEDESNNEDRVEVDVHVAIEPREFDTSDLPAVS